MSSDGTGTRALSADTSPRDGANRVLVVVLGQTRAWELTFESIAANVLDELGADLALCGSDRDQRPNPFYERAKFIWRTPEPDDWAEVYDRTVGDSSWRVLLRPGENTFGGIRDVENPQVGVGGLLIYVWRFLGESLERDGLIDAYSWLIITRSDFLWPVPHPDVRYLSNRRIYVLDGEQWGGVSDRHYVVPRRLVRRFLRVPDPVFTDPRRLRRRLDRRSAAQGWTALNPERFFAARLKELGLWRRVRFLPYIPYLVRAEGGSTAWSRGVFDEELGCYVKYPAERESSQISQSFVRDQGSWRRYLAPIRGALARRRLRKIYRERGLSERPFPLREKCIRAYRMARWTVLRHRDAAQRAVLRLGSRLRQRVVLRLGSHLRKVPRIRTLLDARVRRMQRRGERRQAAAAERHEAEKRTAAHARDEGG
jgi:hypothetical protein